MRALFVATVLLATASARADRGTSTARSGRVEPAFVTTGTQPRPARALADRAPATFARLAAAGWHALWDRDTGVVAELSGTFVPAPGANNDPTIAERVARAFVAAHLDVLAPGADFVVVANRLDDGVRSVGFQQTYRGLRVAGAQLGVVFRADRLFAVTSTAIPNPSVLIAPSAIASPARAEAWVARETGLRVATSAHRERVVLPIVHPGGVELHVADVFDVAALDAPGRWTVYVAPDGTPLARASTIADASATLQYNAGVRYAAGARSFVPAVTAHITVNAVAATTAVDGAFSWAGAVPGAVNPSCHGTSATVFNMAGSDATTSIPTPDGATVGWTAANVELDDAQISTYVYGNIAIARARVINPAIAAWLTGPIEFDVNENNPCNAFSTGDVVHLARGVAGCENTGRVADIVFHEFGHSLHFHSIIPGMGNFQLDLSEGLADFNAANINDDSGIGRGLDFTDAAVRDIDPPGFEARYPDDVNIDTHITGEIISGALWDLRKALGATLTEKVFAGVMQRAADIPGSYMAALVADDDNGDLGDLTPHYCAIYNAFGPHGLAPEYRQTVVSKPVVDEQLAISVPVTIPAGTPCPPRHVTAMHVLWKIGDSIANEMLLEDHDTAWTGTFPAQPDGTVLSYSVDITFDDGTTLTFPDNPADPMYQVFVGTPKQIYCKNFDTDPQWNLTGDWQWTIPTTAAARAGDPLVPYTGTHLLGTNVTGGDYAPSATATAETPDILTTSYQLVHLQYRRWLVVQDAAYDQAQIFVNDMPVWQNASGLDHVDREWRFHDVDLTPFIDGHVTLRWQLTSDAIDQRGGWSIDDVCVVGMHKLAVCGDGFVDYNEQCDDGNTFSGDGCSAACKDEIEAGSGGCSAGGAAGSPLLALLVVRVRRRRATR